MFDIRLMGYSSVLLKNNFEIIVWAVGLFDGVEFGEDGRATGQWFSMADQLRQPARLSNHRQGRAPIIRLAGLVVGVPDAVNVKLPPQDRANHLLGQQKIPGDVAHPDHMTARRT